MIGQPILRSEIRSALEAFGKAVTTDIKTVSGQLETQGQRFLEEAVTAGESGRLRHLLSQEVGDDPKLMHRMFDWGKENRIKPFFQLHKKQPIDEVNTTELDHLWRRLTEEFPHPVESAGISYNNLADAVLQHVRDNPDELMPIETTVLRELGYKNLDEVTPHVIAWRNHKALPKIRFYANENFPKLIEGSYTDTAIFNALAEALKPSS